MSSCGVLGRAYRWIPRSHRRRLGDDSEESEAVAVSAASVLLAGYCPDRTCYLRYAAHVIIATWSVLVEMCSRFIVLTFLIMGDVMTRDIK